MQEDGHWYSNQFSGTFTFEVFTYQKFFVLGARNNYPQSEESCLRFRSGKLISCTHWTRSLLKWQTLQRINLINFSKQLVLSLKNRFFFLFNFTEDHLDTFLGLYLANESQFKDQWHVCKIIFILCHG